MLDGAFDGHLNLSDTICCLYGGFSPHIFVMLVRPCGFYFKNFDTFVVSFQFPRLDTSPWLVTFASRVLQGWCPTPFLPDAVNPPFLPTPWTNESRHGGGWCLGVSGIWGDQLVCYFPTLSLQGRMPDVVSLGMPLGMSFEMCYGFNAESFLLGLVQWVC